MKRPLARADFCLQIFSVKSIAVYLNCFVFFHCGFARLPGLLPGPDHFMSYEPKVEMVKQIGAFENRIDKINRLIKTNIEKVDLLLWLEG